MEFRSDTHTIYIGTISKFILYRLLMITLILRQADFKVNKGFLTLFLSEIFLSSCFECFTMFSWGLDKKRM